MDAKSTLLLLVRDGRIVSSVKIAEGDREFYIECVGRPVAVDGKQPAGVWNDECYSVLAELAL